MIIGRHHIHNSVRRMDGHRKHTVYLMGSMNIFDTIEEREEIKQGRSTFHEEP